MGAPSDRDAAQPKIAARGRRFAKRKSCRHALIAQVPDEAEANQPSDAVAARSSSKAANA